MDRRSNGKSASVMGYLDFYRLAEKDKREVFEMVAYMTGMPSFAVEKDWWVVRVLDIVFQTEIGAYTVFKGGTSLSKSWGLIERFSEDVDLALDRSFLGFTNLNPTKKEITKLRKSSKLFILNHFIPDLKLQFENALLDKLQIKVRETKESDQDPLILEIYYDHVTEYSDYILPRVILEIGIRSLREPFTVRKIKSVVGEQLADRPFADAFISIPSVNPERTFLEKLFLLHEEFQRPKEKVRIERLSRHLYDIHQIAKTDFANTAIDDQELYNTIIEHRSVFAKLGGVNYDLHYPPYLNPIPPDEIMEEWERDYATMQEQMIYGETISFQELISSVKAIINKLQEK